MDDEKEKQDRIIQNIQDSISDIENCCDQYFNEPGYTFKDAKEYLLNLAKEMIEEFEE